MKDLLKKTKARMCCLQETKLEIVNPRIIRAIWGSNNFDWEFSKSEGSTGGMISIWDPTFFTKTSAWGCRDYLVVNGFLIDDGKNCTVINVYASNSPPLRHQLWDQLGILVSQRSEDLVCLIGDFNSIRAVSERVGRGSVWNRSNMNAFNDFVDGNNLLDLQLAGRRFTWYRPNGTCKSRLDRMIVMRHGLIDGQPRSSNVVATPCLTTARSSWRPKGKTGGPNLSVSSMDGCNTLHSNLSLKINGIHLTFKDGVHMLLKKN